MIKCIVCDLDGTLIKYDDTMEKRTEQLLKKCIAQGIEFIIATGRDINMVIDFLNQYQLDCDLILNNGTQYCNKELTMNDIYPMSYDAFSKISTILSSYGYLLAIHTNQGKYSFVDADAFWDYHYKLLLASKDYKGFLPEKTFTTRSGYLRDFHYAKDAHEIIQKNDGLDISSSFEDNIEITSSITNKGKLLEKVIKEKGYAYDEVAVFGDGQNDVPMLQLFPYSFAPKNASQSAKDAARYVLSTTNEEGAVFEGLEQLYKAGILKI